jgi:cell division inhibitor SulA
MSFVDDARDYVTLQAGAGRQLRHATAAAMCRAVHIGKLKVCVAWFICLA